MQHSTLEFPPDSRVAVVTLCRESAHNALSQELCRSLIDDLERARASEARALVLRSSAKHFSVGADLHERRSLDSEGLLAAREPSAQLTRGLVDFPVPTIAVLHGFALGGGYELALACDYVIAEQTTRVGLPEAGIGIVPGGGGTQLLNRRVGWGVANRLLFTGEIIAADEAARLGLVDEITAESAGTARALELAAVIAGKNPQSIRLIKEAVRRGHGASLSQGLDHEDEAWRVAATSADYRQGLDAFAAKVPPPWAGSAQ